MAELRERWRGVRKRLSPPYAELIEWEISDATSVLDVGCGAYSPSEPSARSTR